ncbi:MAG: DUF2752 domain-containing protein, partial [Bacteroidales bacterium]|nr:DUF2752 domain-containing protein [Bacteroidales bacterium]
MSKNRLYALTLCACTGGWVWLLLADARDTDFTLCLFKLVTHIPCPACGSTRAAQCLLHGNLHNALLINPLGVITALCMAVFPSWILIDRTLNRPT